jgi:hypothetical protein
MNAAHDLSSARSAVRFRCIAGVIATLLASLWLTSCSRSIEGSAAAASSVVQENASKPQGLPESPTGYYGVYTASNVVLFGKLVRIDSDWITLANVHYIRSNMDPEKKQVANQLVKRVREWHAPAESTIARANVIVIEPVASDSRVMTLIREMK